MTKQILYIMNVDWDWIKQRPQYLAEELTKYFFVDVVLPIKYRKHNNVKDRERQIPLNYWFQLPFGRFSMIRKINNWLIYFYLKFIIKLQDYDLIWMATPIYFSVVKKIISDKQKVIYDCMDDSVEFPSLKGVQEYCLNEKQLIERADHVFFSANYLRRVILKRYHINNIDSTIINNALIPKWVSVENSKKKIADGKIHIIYIGTIAQWFDFELIEKSLEKFSNIQYEFYGPIDKGVIFNHSRVIFHGPIPHSELMNVMQVRINDMKNLGAEFIDISLPSTKYALPVYYIIAPAEASANLARYDGVRFGFRSLNDNKEFESLNDMYIKTRTEGFGEEVKRRLMIGTAVLSSGMYDHYFLKAAKVRRIISNEFADAFSKVDVIMTPTATGGAFAVDDVMSPIDMYMNDVFTVASNLAGVPAISIPAGNDSKTGLPFGMQLIGKMFDESSILRTANIVEKTVAFDNRPSKLFC